MRERSLITWFTQMLLLIRLQRIQSEASEAIVGHTYTQAVFYGI